MLSHDVVVVGGGAAGISVAASLLRRRANLDIEWLAAPKALQDAG